MLSAVSEHLGPLAGVGACLYGLHRVLRGLVWAYLVRRAREADLPAIARAFSGDGFRLPGRRGDAAEGTSVPSD
jgi:hypothetical protein